MSKHGLVVDLVDAILVEFDNGAVGNMGGTGNMAGGRKVPSAGNSTARRAGFIGPGGRDHACICVDETIHELGLTDETRSYYRHATTNNFIETILGRAQNHVSGGDWLAGGRTAGCCLPLGPEQRGSGRGWRRCTNRQQTTGRRQRNQIMG